MGGLPQYRLHLATIARIHHVDISTYAGSRYVVEIADDIVSTQSINLN